MCNTLFTISFLQSSQSHMMWCDLDCWRRIVLL
jgi:hypothetical protein